MNHRFHQPAALFALLAALLTAPIHAQNCPFDNGGSSLEVEGLILTRYALGLTGAPLVASTGINAVDAPTVEASINCPSCGLNITGNPTMTVADATIISRKLAGFSGAALTDNLVLGSGSRNTPAAVQSFLLAGCGATGGTVTSITAGTGLTGGTIIATGTIAADTTYLQRRVTTGCAVGSFITAIAADGTPTCATPSPGAGGTVTSVTAGSGLTGGTITGSGTIAVNTGVIQSRVSATCAAGSSIRAIAADGAVTCQTDTVGGSGTVTSVGSGFGLTGGPVTGSGTLSIDTATVQQRVNGTCAGGTFMQGIGGDGSVQCAGATKRTVYVNQVGTAQENGTALLAAIAAVSASATDPWLVKLDVGSYDIGAGLLALNYVSIEGAGALLTQITGSGTYTVRTNSPVQLSRLGIANTSSAGVAVLARMAGTLSGTIMLQDMVITANWMGIQAGGDSQGVKITTLQLRDLVVTATQYGIFDGDLAASFGPANKLTATSVDIQTSATVGVAVTARLDGSSAPQFLMTHSTIAGNTAISATTTTYPQFQIHLSRIFGSTTTFPSYCAGNVIGNTFVAGGAGGC